MTYNDLLLDDWEIRAERGNLLTLTKDGWIACINKASGGMSIFDSAGVAVRVPDKYEDLEDGRWRCAICGKTADQLEVVAFIGQRCIPCVRARLSDSE